MTIKDVTQALENLAPLTFQESYDNAGLIVGENQTKVSGILISLDCTEAVIEEAIQKKCNLVIAHHPIVFKGLKKFNGKNYVERTVIKAIKNDIAIYASHTNLDHVVGGVNYKIASILGLENLKILAPKNDILKQLTVYVPENHEEIVKNALFSAGAGSIGNYSKCAFSSIGEGQFQPLENANPFIGKINEVEKVKELKIEVIFPNYLESKIVNEMKAAHPYEEVAFQIISLDNQHPNIGAGIIGEIPNEMNSEEFLSFLKEKMNLKAIKFTKSYKEKYKKIAICGGAGSFLLQNALGQNADVFITGDFKYHEFFDAEERLMICDIGHYESEVFTKELILTYLSNIFTNFAILISEINTNPVHYFF